MLQLVKVSRNFLWLSCRQHRFFCLVFMAAVLDLRTENKLGCSNEIDRIEADFIIIKQPSENNLLQIPMMS